MRQTAKLARLTFPRSNVTPPWLLPFWRQFRRHGGDYAQAWKTLPERLPKGVRMPTIEECATVLVDHDLIR